MEENRLKIVFLDRKTIGDDLDLSGFDKLGEVVMYDFSDPGEVPDRVKDAWMPLSVKVSRKLRSCSS